MIVEWHEFEADIDLLGPALERLGKEGLNHAKADPDFDLIREHPRFQAMIAAAEARLGDS